MESEPSNLATLRAEMYIDWAGLDGTFRNLFKKRDKRVLDLMNSLRDALNSEETDGYLPTHGYSTWCGSLDFSEKRVSMRAELGRKNNPRIRYPFKVETH